MTVNEPKDTLDKQIEGYLTRQRAEDILREEPESERERVPSELVQKAKRLFTDRLQIACPHCRRMITPLKKSSGSQKMLNFLWFALAALSFSGSFLFKRYFLQSLVLAALFGIKFIVDSKATKTQIMIYKSLQEDRQENRIKDLQKTTSRL